MTFHVTIGLIADRTMKYTASCSFHQESGHTPAEAVQKMQMWLEEEFGDPAKLVIV